MGNRGGKMGALYSAFIWSSPTVFLQEHSCCPKELPMLSANPPPKLFRCKRGGVGASVPAGTLASELVRGNGLLYPFQARTF